MFVLTFSLIWFLLDDKIIILNKPFSIKKIPCSFEKLLFFIFGT